jgi:aminoglycoside 6'-N-acetyltransferase
MTTIAFRPLNFTDLPNITRWLNDPDVAPWYGEGDPTLEQLTTKYTPLIDGTEPTRGFIIVIDDRDAGYIQGYRIADHPEYARQIEVEPGAVGIDLFIGEAEYRNRGYGSAVLQAFLGNIVFGTMTAPVAIIAPEPGNLRAIRSYAKAGFRWIKTVYIHDPDEPDNTGDEYVMIQRNPSS